MRLHHLTVSAFGPFAGTEHLDFDELNEAGLFLMTGATGSGKSSLLDAVCFALYGTVPGARSVKTLHSQHARPEAQPHVVLDFSVRDRRFVVRRTPEWSRPKRRGPGLVTEPASALITETTTGTDVFLSSRAAEVGLLIGELMGMSAGQFAQVALLPQGEFQTFLRASSQERHDVLQQLFRTDRFAAIEDFVQERSRRLRDDAATGASEAQRLLDTLADRTTVVLPEDLSGDALATAAVEDRVLPWADTVRDAAGAAAQRAGSARDGAGLEVDRLRTLHDEATLGAEHRRRLDDAAATLEGLESSQSEAQLAAELLESDGRAAPCRPLLALLAHEEATRVGLLESSAVAMAALGGSPVLDLPGRPTAHALNGLADGLRDRLALLRALEPRERAAAQLRGRRDDDRRRLRRAEVDQRSAADRAGQLPAELVEQDDRLRSAASLAGTVEPLVAGRDAAAGRQPRGGRPRDRPGPPARAGGPAALGARPRPGRSCAGARPDGPAAGGDGGGAGGQPDPGVRLPGLRERRPSASRQRRRRRGDAGRPGGGRRRAAWPRDCAGPGGRDSGDAPL